MKALDLSSVGRRDEDQDKNGLGGKEAGVPETETMNSREQPGLSPEKGAASRKQSEGIEGIVSEKQAEEEVSVASQDKQAATLEELIEGREAGLSSDRARAKTQQPISSQGYEAADRKEEDLRTQLHKISTVQTHKEQHSIKIGDASARGRKAKEGRLLKFLTLIKF